MLVDASNAMHGCQAQSLNGEFPSASLRNGRSKIAHRFPAIFGYGQQQSFTGQPTVEFHLVGSQPLLSQLTKLLCSEGARLAEPGEFTFRAFLAGRMDLAQCEGLLGVIHAENRRNLDVALRQLAGGIAPLLQGVRQQLIELTADIEAGLDFVDEDIEFVTSEDIEKRISGAIKEVKSTRDRIESRRANSIARTAVAMGLPNAGKSSLINRLLGKDISIVSPQAGTTRDYLRGRLNQSDLDLVDTAGLESTQESRQKPSPSS